MLAARYEWLLDQAEAALAQSDSGAAFEAFVHELADFQARHRALAETMATAIDLPSSAEPTRQALRRAISRLLTNAQAAGAIRDDVGPADVTMLFSGVAHATAIAGDLQPMLRTRHLAIILDGLRPHASTTLPGKAIDFAQLDRVKKRRKP